MQFDPNINLGQLIIAASFIGGMMGLYFKLDTKIQLIIQQITGLITRIDGQDKRLDKQDERTNTLTDSMMKATGEINKLHYGDEVMVRLSESMKRGAATIKRRQENE